MCIHGGRGWPRTRTTAVSSKEESLPCWASVVSSVKWWWSLLWCSWGQVCRFSPLRTFYNVRHTCTHNTVWFTKPRALYTSPLLPIRMLPCLFFSCPYTHRLCLFYLKEALLCTQLLNFKTGIKTTSKFPLHTSLIKWSFLLYVLAFPTCVYLVLTTSRTFTQVKYFPASLGNALSVLPLDALGHLVRKTSWIQASWNHSHPCDNQDGC